MTGNEFAPPSEAFEPESDLSLLDLLVTLSIRRRTIVVSTVSLLVIGLLLAFLLPIKFTATTSILPPQQNQGGAALLSQLGSLGSASGLASSALGGLKNPNDLQVALLRSRTVEDAVVNRFHLRDRYKVKLQSAARARLEKTVSISNGAKDGLITLEVVDRDPRFAADLANGYIEEFKRNTARLAITEASQRRLFFEEQLAQAKENLANAEEDLKKTEQSTGMIQMDSQARALITSVAQLRAQIAAKQVEIQGMETYATAENPELQTARQELTGLQSQLAKTGASADELMLPHSNLQQTGLEYVRKLRDVKYYETIFDLLARQYEAAKVDEARQGATIQVVDRAVVPDKKSSPKRALILAGATVFGLMLGMALAFTGSAMERVKNNPAEAQRIEALSAAWRSKR